MLFQDERLPLRNFHQGSQVVLLTRWIYVCIQMVVEHPEPAVEAHVDARRLDQGRLERFQLQLPGLQLGNQIAVGEQHLGSLAMR